MSEGGGGGVKTKLRNKSVFRPEMERKLLFFLFVSYPWVGGPLRTFFHLTGNLYQEKNDLIIEEGMDE